jgi:hypothetical protein
MKSEIFVALLVAMLLAVPISQAYGDEADGKPPVALKVVDVVIVRPVSAAVAAGLTAVSVGTMPLAYVCGIGEHSVRILIEAPWRFTAARKFGEFNSYKDGKPITVIPD